MPPVETEDQHGACRGGRRGRSIFPRISSAMAGLTVSAGAAWMYVRVPSASSDGRTYSVSDTSSSCSLADDDADDRRTTLGPAAGAAAVACTRRVPADPDAAAAQ
jgi:hypothetical protein